MTNRWTILFVLFLARVAMGWQFQSIASVRPDLIDRFGVDNATIGFLVGLFLLPGILLAIPGGFLGRALGDKRTLLAGLALMALGGAITGYAESFAMLVAGRAIAGAGVILLFIIIPKTVTDWFPGRTLFFAMGAYLNGWPVGIGLGLVFQPQLADAAGVDWVFYSTGIVAAAALLSTFLGYRAAPPAEGNGEGGLRIRLSGAEIVLVSIAALIWTMSNSAFSNIMAFAPAYVESQGYSAVEAGAIVSINIWIAVIAVPFGGLLATRLGGPNLFIILASALGGTAIVLMAVIPSQFILLFAIMGVILFLPAGVLVALPMQVLRPENRATGLGVFYTWWYSGMAGLPPVGGWTFDVTGDAASPVVFAGILVLLMMPLLLAFRLLQRRWRPA